MAHNSEIRNTIQQQVPDEPEYNSGELLVEPSGSRTIRMMVESIRDGGMRLQARRVAEYDYQAGQEDDGYTPPERSPEWELKDYYTDHLQALDRLAELNNPKHYDPPEEPETPEEPPVDPPVEPTE